MENTLPPYALLELDDITPVINQPIASTSRIKYTCFDVSKNLIVFGATSGGVYVFSRSPVEFSQLIPNKEGVITKISISCDEKYISFANGKGIVTVVERNQGLGAQPCVLSSREHQGNEVTAMMWSAQPVLLYMGDDIGRISILQIPTLLTKTMFHSTTQVIMNLDSRICQIDITHYMLVVSTLTRCYISHTEKEQFRQIGQKLRDGEYGVCFLTCTDHKDNGKGKAHNDEEEQQEIKQYHAMTADDNFTIDEKLANTLIYCGRPSSRLWEASIDGIVKRTHQYKQVLAKPPNKVFKHSSYNHEVNELNDNRTEREVQSISFTKLHALRNCVILTYKKDAIYFLNTENVENTVWFDDYKDIADCKVFENSVFIWHQNGTITSLMFFTIEKFILKCYLDEKYQLCAELCSLYSDYLMSTNTLSPKLSIIGGLKIKLSNNITDNDSLNLVLAKLASLKTKQATKMNSGIFVVENTHEAKSFLQDMGKESKDTNVIATETMQALKDLSNTVTDRLSSSKRILKEKWEGLEEKIKSIDLPLHDSKQNTEFEENEINNRNTKKTKEVYTEKEDFEVNQEILHSSSHSKQIVVENNTYKDIYKSLYKNYKLYEHKKGNESNICSVLCNISCDIKEIYNFLLHFKEYCKSIEISDDESEFIIKNIFLIFVDASTKEDLSIIIEDANLYEIFVDACVCVNLKSNRISHSSCECGYPLPFTNKNETPLFSDLIDRFVEKQWTNHTQAQCYEICKRMPYLWRKILFLRRNEDLLNILLLLLQILDENLLYSFLPQFTLDTWARTMQLYSILSANVCLNCNKKFENIEVKKILSWDALGLLLIKSVGGSDAIKVMKDHADLMEEGDLTLKFYHTCFLVAKYEKFDGMIRNQLVDTLYAAYDFEDARIEICRLVRSTVNEELKNTSLPVLVASKSHHWGLDFINSVAVINSDDETHPAKKDICMDEILQCIKSESDCILCGISLVNKVLISDGGIWVFKCGHIFHRACLDLLRNKLCPQCLSQG